eukprot:scaffold5346_cov86-Isochrysis_galbana.AAC.1
MWAHGHYLASKRQSRAETCASASAAARACDAVLVVRSCAWVLAAFGKDACANSLYAWACGWLNSYFPPTNVGDFTLD